jgi:hypothetical protein
MHVCLLIDGLTLCALIHGLCVSVAASRKLLCLGSLIYLLAVTLHYYFLFAPWFGLFHRNSSMAAIGIAELLDFFGGFWTFFGVMVFVKGVAYIGLAFMFYDLYRWFSKTGTNSPQIQPVPNSIRERS